MATPPTTSVPAKPWRDLLFIALLLTLAAVPLLLLRHDSLMYSPLFIGAFWFSFATLCASWLLRDPYARTDAPVAACARFHRLRLTAVAAVMLPLMLVVFYLPMRQHFWGGYDEVLCFNPRFYAIWSPLCDKLSRPTWGLAPLAGSLLSPGRIDGFLWLAGALNLLNSLLLAGIIRRVMPGEPAIAAAAGVLLLCHRGDLSRFFVMWTGIWYWTSLSFLLLGGWLFLRSAHSGNRLGLIAACLSLGTAILGSEAGFTLAAFAPILLYLSGVRGARFVVWSAAWCSALVVLAARYLQYLLTTENSYQAVQSAGVFSNPQLLLHNLSIQAEPFWNWFSGFRDVRAYRRSAFAAAALTGLAVALAGRSAQGSGIGRCVVGAVVAAAVALAGLLPFVPFAYPFRTQFYTAPGQAALIALALGSACRLLGRRLGLVALATSLAALGCIAAAGNREFQRTADKSVTFAKTVHLLRQIHGLTPNTDFDTLTVLLPEDGTVGALGACYSLAIFTYDQLDTTVVSYDGDASIGVKIAFHPDRISLLNLTPGLWQGERNYPYEKLILCRVTADGTVSLVREVPDDVPIPDVAAAKYQPLPLLRPGPIREVPYICYPSWIAEPPDVLDVESGLLFGSGWSEIQWQDGRLSRLAGPGAELLINPQDRTSRTIDLEAEVSLPRTGVHYALEVRDGAGCVLTRSPLDGREKLSLTIPTDPAQTSLISLWVTADCQSLSGSADASLRIWAPAGAKWVPSPPARRDVMRGGVRFGQGWSQPELAGEQPIRWLGVEAEIVLGRRNPEADLLLDLAAGPALGGKPGLLRVLAPDGRLLHEEEIPQRGRIRVRVPPELPVGTIVKLEVRGESRQVGGDPRILNAQVFRCAWATDDDDITRGELRLGQNWYPFERFSDENFRWLNTGAEIILKRPSAGELVLTAVGGPGLFAGASTLRLVGPDGQVLHAGELTENERREFHWPLPPGLPAGAVLRLEVVGGGRASPDDPRILNVRVLRCEIRR